MPLGWMAHVSEPSFARDGGDYFLATKSTWSSAVSAKSVAVKVDLTPVQRRDLDAVIDQQMRVTLPSVFAPKVGEFGEPTLSVTPADREVQAGRSQLVTHVEAYRLAPDRDPRFYVRAHWTVAGASHVGMTLWIRFDGHRFTVERTDATVTLRSHYGSEGIGDLTAPRAGGSLLNVIPSGDGWAYLIEDSFGYEAAEIAVWKYGPDGPMETGIAWGTGC